MRKVVVGLLGAAMVTSVGIMLPASATAAPPADPAPAANAGRNAAPIDYLPSPIEDKRRALRTAAVSDVVSGKATAVTRNGSTVVKLGRDRSHGRGKDQYVELSRERTDRIFVILAEFGNDRYPGYPDVDTDPDTPGPTTYDGPLHNAIPAPDRTKDNSTVWQADYNADHYRQLYFGTGKNAESLKTYMQTESSGRYSVDGEVTDWVKVPYNEARYGRDLCGSNVCSNTWALVKDAANQWVADQKAAGRSDAEIAADMKSFDQYDRYDYDNDGDFNEPVEQLDRGLGARGRRGPGHPPRRHGRVEQAAAGLAELHDGPGRQVQGGQPRAGGVQQRQGAGPGGDAP